MRILSTCCYCNYICICLHLLYLGISFCTAFITKCPRLQQWYFLGLLSKACQTYQAYRARSCGASWAFPLLVFSHLIEFSLSWRYPLRPSPLESLATFFAGSTVLSAIPPLCEKYRHVIGAKKGRRLVSPNLWWRVWNGQASFSKTSKVGKSCRFQVETTEQRRKGKSSPRLAPKSKCEAPFFLGVQRLYGMQSAHWKSMCALFCRKKRTCWSTDKHGNLGSWHTLTLPFLIPDSWLSTDHARACSIKWHLPLSWWFGRCQVAFIDVLMTAMAAMTAASLETGTSGRTF